MNLTKQKTNKQMDGELLLVSFPDLGDKLERRIVVSFAFEDDEEWDDAAYIFVPSNADENFIREIVRTEVRGWGPVNYGKPLFKVYWNENDSETIEGEGEFFPLLDSDALEE